VSERGLRQLTRLAGVSPRSHGWLRAAFPLETHRADGQLLSEVTRWSVEQLQLKPGIRVFALIKSVALMA
ncbi:MAG: TOBE domain-containing protein, partial [Halothiobacillaceae bacterium]